MSIINPAKRNAFFNKISDLVTAYTITVRPDSIHFRHKKTGEVLIFVKETNRANFTLA